jgi:predicted  nucleic acid-binding Zn-ribbon protein
MLQFLFLDANYKTLLISFVIQILEDVRDLEKRRAQLEQDLETTKKNLEQANKDLEAKEKALQAVSTRDIGCLTLSHM